MLLSQNADGMALWILNEAKDLCVTEPHSEDTGRRSHCSASTWRTSSWPHARLQNMIEQ